MEWDGLKKGKEDEWGKGMNKQREKNEWSDRIWLEVASNNNKANKVALERWEG